MAKKFLKKITRGDSNYVSGLIVTWTMLIITILSVVLLKDISLSSDIKQACRGYLYTMEVKGYLTDANREALEHDLEALGAKNIDFTGTTLNDVGYGGVVTLKITCDIPFATFDLLTNSSGYIYNTVSLTRHTVAKS